MENAQHGIWNCGVLAEIGNSLQMWTIARVGLTVPLHNIIGAGETKLELSNEGVSKKLRKSRPYEKIIDFGLTRLKM